jgi:hypothetical protein
LLQAVARAELLLGLPVFLTVVVAAAVPAGSFPVRRLFRRAHTLSLLALVELDRSQQIQLDQAAKTLQPLTLPPLVVEVAAEIE